MSHITLIHSDHWLLRASLSELPMGCCPLLAVCQRGQGRKCQCRRRFIRFGGHMGGGADLEIWLSVRCCVTWCFRPKLNMYSATWQIWSCNSFSSYEFSMKCLSDCLTKRRKLPNIAFSHTDGLNDSALNAKSKGSVSH